MQHLILQYSRIYMVPAGAYIPCASASLLPIHVHVFIINKKILYIMYTHVLQNNLGSTNHGWGKKEEMLLNGK